MATSNDRWGTALLLTAASVLFLCAVAEAKIQMSVDVGWSQRFRPGRWTPLYVTLADAAPRQVVVDVYAPTGRRYALRATESLTISPVPVTVAMYVPLSYRVDESSVTVRDAVSGKRLDDFILSDNAAFPGNMVPGLEAIDPSAILVGISGGSDTQRLLESQFSHNAIRTALIPQPLLPTVPIGFDALDLLVLSQPDLNLSRTVDQQRAIADWVRAGGTLLIVPGADPFPATGPLVEIMPCSIGPNRMFQADTSALSGAGLPARMRQLKGRTLINPAPDARPIRLLGASEPWGYRRWVGYGQVVVLGADVSPFIFDSPQHSLDFWRGALTSVIALPETDAAQPNYGWQMDERRGVPMRKTMDWIGDIPGAGSFGFSYVAGTLLALMLIVGPLDWFVLKWMGKQPWTWVTITGWIGVVTLSALYVGHMFKAGELYFRTASLIDEAGGMRVAAGDVIGIYSPQTRDYALDTEPEGWWRPASDGEYYGSNGLELEIAAHQDYHGNTPLPMTVNVWNLRFLENTQYGPAAPVIDAKLTQSGGTVSGKITNRGSVALTEVRVRTSRGVARVVERIDPGATAQITGAPLNPKDISLATMPANNDPQRRWQRYEVDADAPATRPAQPLLAGIGDQRSAQIDCILRDRSDVACVYANYDAPPERVKLVEDEELKAKEAHIGLVRALVALE